MWSRVVPWSLFTLPARSRTKGRAAITFLNPSNVASPDAVSEKSISSAFSRIVENCSLPVAGSNLTNVFSMNNYLWDDAITRCYKHCLHRILILFRILPYINIIARVNLYNSVFKKCIKSFSFFPIHLMYIFSYQIVDK